MNVWVCTTPLRSTLRVKGWSAHHWSMFSPRAIASFNLPPTHSS